MAPARRSGDRLFYATVLCLLRFTFVTWLLKLYGDYNYRNGSPYACVLVECNVVSRVDTDTEWGSIRSIATKPMPVVPLTFTRAWMSYLAFGKH